LNTLSQVRQVPRYARLVKTGYAAACGNKKCREYRHFLFLDIRVRESNFKSPTSSSQSNSNDSYTRTFFMKYPAQEATQILRVFAVRLHEDLP